MGWLHPVSQVSGSHPRQPWLGCNRRTGTILSCAIPGSSHLQPGCREVMWVDFRCLRQLELRPGGHQVGHQQPHQSVSARFQTRTCTCRGRDGPVVHTRGRIIGFVYTLLFQSAVLLMSSSELELQPEYLSYLTEKYPWLGRRPSGTLMLNFPQIKDFTRSQKVFCTLEHSVL